MSFAFSLHSVVPLLVAASAGGYAIATVGMKSSSNGQIALGLTLGVIGFVLAFGAEVVMLRRYDLSLVYVAVIAAESMLVLAWAYYIGEGLSPRQYLGAFMVVAGLAAVAA
ncbi:5-aminolevulinate synthase [Roseovarius sp. Pro17]|uniref:5-aminolevulinate synthase n=1 Tax=Roseovarius sp. Pro17 TaxID=3108175 RepID=UPI002D7691E1|nr:5-aminolevulinate synthase [Roseovarius sp. Pro17]